MEHFGIDLLNEYGTEPISGTLRPVVNPDRRELDRRRRSVQSKLNRRYAAYSALTLHPGANPEKVIQWETQKAELLEEIQQFERELTSIKSS